MEKINPYRYLGEIHNNGLDYIIERLQKNEQTEISTEQILEIVIEYLGTITKDDTVAATAINYILVAETLNRIQSTEIEELLSNSGITQEVKAIIKMTLELSDTEYETAAHGIAEGQKKILTSDIPKRDEILALTFFSVAESSNKYWKSLTSSAPWQKFKKVVNKLPWKKDAFATLEALVQPTVEGVIPRAIMNGSIDVLKGAILPAIATGIVISAISYFEEGRKEEKDDNEVKTKTRLAKGTEKKIKIQPMKFK